MNVASIELCGELYDLSHWDGTDLVWCIDQSNKAIGVYHVREIDPMATRKCIAYDLGYLLRKLPHKTRIDKHTIWGHPDKRRRMPDKDVYNVFLHTATNQNWQQADTPEDAACKLAIELFKQGILNKP